MHPATLLEEFCSLWAHGPKRPARLESASICEALGRPLVRCRAPGATASPDLPAHGWPSGRRRTPSVPSVAARGNRPPYPLRRRWRARPCVPGAQAQGTRHGNGRRAGWPVLGSMLSGRGGPSKKTKGGTSGFGRTPLLLNVHFSRSVGRILCYGDLGGCPLNVGTIGPTPSREATMRQRGRKSAANLAVVPVAHDQRPPPPGRLSAAEAGLGDTAERFPPHWFEGHEPVLEAYCVAVDLAVFWASR